MIEAERKDIECLGWVMVRAEPAASWSFGNRVTVSTSDNKAPRINLKSVGAWCGIGGLLPNFLPYIYSRKFVAFLVVRTTTFYRTFYPIDRPSDQCRTGRSPEERAILPLSGADQQVRGDDWGAKIVPSPSPKGRRTTTFERMLECAAAVVQNRAKIAKSVIVWVLTFN